jgi:valyl-tRNA synthetase
MIKMEKRYDPKTVEPKIQDFWEKNKLFRFDPKSNKKIYSIDTPPRYASGPLHIGHATSYSHQDFIGRFKRMQGFNVLYPLCFDVNGLPIEVNVEKLGIFPEKVGRDAFIKKCREFAEKNIKTMTDQFKILGFSMDSSIYYQTDAEYFRRLTQISFIRLHKEGLVYKGEAPVNWCPRCSTALADAEIEYKTRTTKLNYIRFPINSDSVTIATTRPELLPACVKVAVHPDDKRKLIEKKVTVPLFDKKIKITKEETIDPEFGTGIVMYCSFGDLTDIEVIRKNKLDPIKVIDEKGNLVNAGKYSGLTVKDGRKKILKDLQEQGFLEKQEDLEQNTGTCWRCKTPVEYLIMKEWFLKILPFKNKVLKLSKQMKWYPEFMEDRLKNWVKSLNWDWCISRRRYLATPVPIWECENCNEIILAKEKQCYVNPLKDKPPKKCKCGKMKGTEMVFDTWMDSSITVLFNAFWERDGKLFKKLFPITMRPQSHDIIRTWAFYTMIRSLLLTKKRPFDEIVISGYIMGPDGKPMHTSLGNVVDPLEVLEKYNADSLRYFAGLNSLGTDTAFRWKDLDHCQKLLTKIWNIARFSKDHMNKEKAKLKAIDKWILNELSDLIKNVTDSMSKYNFSATLPLIEDFVWHKLADNYIEIVKTRLYQEKDKAAQYALYQCLLNSLKLLAPILPHITEEIWQNLFKDLGESIHLSEWPKSELFDKKSKESGEIAVAIISSLRQYKSSKGLPLNSELEKVSIECDDKIQDKLKNVLDDIKSTMKIKNLEFGKGNIEVEGYPVKISIS